MKSKATKRDYQAEYAAYHGRPEQIKRRSERNKARRKMKSKGRKVSGKDVNHINHNTSDNSMSNLNVQSKRKNRSDNGK
jgi:hypothetical protein